MSLSISKSISDDAPDENSLVQNTSLLDLNDTAESEQEITRPSEVQGRTHVYYTTQFENESYPKGGKWMIFAQGDMEQLNHRWNTLKRLYHEGTIIGIKSSTSMDLECGVTMCYTRDVDDIEAVKKAADGIRNLIDHEYVIYYKTNRASSENQYRKYESKAINMYMHTVRGQLYKQDHLKRWELYVA